MISADMTRSDLEALFHLPLGEAAEKAGIGRTLFKKVCRSGPQGGIRPKPKTLAHA